jgi:hypothetical protein
MHTVVHGQASGGAAGVVARKGERESCWRIGGKADKTMKGVMDGRDTGVDFRCSQRRA